MDTTIFLAVNRYGLAKATKNKPSLARDQIAIAVKLSIPDSAFRSPIIEATLDVPDHAIIAPELVIEIVEP